MKNVLTILFILVSSASFSQEYLDPDNRIMKLTEISTDKSYGFVKRNPVKVGGDKNAVGAYLNALKAPDGSQIRLDDMKFNVDDILGLQMVVISWQKESATLYILQAEFETPLCPAGFTFKTIDDLPKVEEFPQDKIVKVKACNKDIYSVDHFLLKEDAGELPSPGKVPEFKGGLNELKKYFASHSLTDERAQQMVFRVSISFIVNCEGQAGNFKILSKGRGELNNYANQVLAVVNNMPQQWEPAKKGKNTVDCYQVLSFTVLKGSLEQVAYMEK